MIDATMTELAELLARLRREGRQQSGLDPRLVPPDSEAAYRVAALIAADLGWPVAGWKIAAWKSELQKALRTTAPIYGRVFAPFVIDSPATMVPAKLLHPVVECELVAKLATDLPSRPHPYTREEVDAAVASLHPGIEVAECRSTRDAAFPPITAILADGSGSGSIVLGPPIENWRQRDVAGQQVTLHVNGELRGQGTAAAAIDHPLEPLTWLANELSRTGIGLKAGQVVSTGTLTGMIRGRPGETHVASYGALGEVRVQFVA